MENTLLELPKTTEEKISSIIDSTEIILSGLYGYEVKIRVIKQNDENFIPKLKLAVANFWGIDLAELMSKGRKKEACFARYFAYHILDEKNMTAQNIAQHFNRDRSTISHGLETFSDMYETDKVFRERYDNFLKIM